MDLDVFTYDGVVEENVAPKQKSSRSEELEVLFTKTQSSMQRIMNVDIIVKDRKKSTNEQDGDHWIIKETEPEDLELREMHLGFMNETGAEVQKVIHLVDKMMTNNDSFRQSKDQSEDHKNDNQVIKTINSPSQLAREANNKIHELQEETKALKAFCQKQHKIIEKLQRETKISRERNRRNKTDAKRMNKIMCDLKEYSVDQDQVIQKLKSDIKELKAQKLLSNGQEEELKEFNQFIQEMGPDISGNDELNSSDTEKSKQSDKKKGDHKENVSDREKALIDKVTQHVVEIEQLKGINNDLKRRLVASEKSVRQKSELVLCHLSSSNDSSWGSTDSDALLAAGNNA